MEVNKNFAENLVRLRKGKELSATDLASILSIDVEQYKKYEYGMEMPTIDNLEKISRFYGIQPVDLMVKQTQNGDSSIQQAVENKIVSKSNTCCNKTNSVRYFNSKVINIILLCLAGLAFIGMFLPMMQGHIDLSLANMHASTTYTLTFADFFSGSAQFVLLILFWVMIFVWDIVDNILLLCGFNGKYAYISKIFRLITGCLSIIVLAIAFLSTNTNARMLGGGMALLCISITQLICKIIGFVKTQPENDKKVITYNSNKKYNLILLCMAIFAFIVIFIKNSEQYAFIEFFALDTYWVLCILIWVAIILWDIIDSCILLYSNDSQYIMFSKIFKIITGCLGVLDIIYMTILLSTTTPLLFGTYLLYLIAVIELVYKIFVVCETKPIVQQNNIQ